MKVLVISGHNDLKNSLANQTILNEIENQLPDVEVRKLDALYPDGKIDVAAEQAALLRADLIVWQFPMYWYSLPALMKKWLDEVFQYGFAYGSTAVLGGKKFLVSFTTGAPADSYAGNADSFSDMTKLIEMYSNISKLCNLDYCGASWICGESPAGRQTPEATEAQRQEAVNYVQNLIQRIKGMA